MERLIEFRGKQEQDIEQLLVDLAELLGQPIALEDIEDIGDEGETVWLAETDHEEGAWWNDKVAAEVTTPEE